METLQTIFNQDPEFYLFWISLISLLIGDVIILRHYMRKINKNQVENTRYKYIFLTPSGRVHPSEFPIIPTEEGIFEQALKAQRFSISHPYYKVACVPVQLTDYSNVIWGYGYDYFGHNADNRVFGEIHPWSGEKEVIIVIGKPNE